MTTPTEAAPTLGSTLRQLREYRQLSRDALAHLVGCHVTYISHLESGKKVSSEEMTQRLDAELSADGTLIQQWHSTSSTRSSKPRRVHQLPSAPPRLLGAGDLVTALDEATADTAAPVVLTGPAGVGKTALALHWAQRRHSRWDESSLVLHCRGRDHATPPRTARELVTRLLHDLHTRDLPDETDRRAALLRSRLRHRRILLLLDDVSDAEQIRPLVDIPGITLVITARGALPGLALSHYAQHIPVEPASDELARRMLRLILGTRDDDAVLDRIAAACDRLPLALRASATYALDRHLTGIELAGSLETAPLALLHAAAGRDPQTSLPSLLRGSGRHLHRTSPDAVSLLQQAAAEPDRPLDLDRAVQLTGRSRDEARQLVDDLAREHLLTASLQGWRLSHLVTHWATRP